MLMLLTACAGPGAATRDTPVVAAGEEGQPVVIARSYTLESRVLKETRRINVYLPPGYAEGQARLPVLYLLDGGLQEDFHHITGIAQLASLNHAMGEVIVVGIEGTDRKRDFTHPSSDPEDRKVLPTSGGSAAFREFLTRELKPWVEARYRTSGSAIIGESLAGLFIVETFLLQPELFERYIAVSPSLWWDQQSLAKQSVAKLKAHPAGPRSLFLTIANEGSTMQEGVDALVAALKAHAPSGLRWHYEPMPEEQHSTIYHPAAFKAVRLLFPVAPAEAPAQEASGSQAEAP
ncbi:alpha/beta hydrolase [Pyxidicoccus fallax]|nr:alpha/beta hydrolase-fold protein [Pyxidicoccus fallax]